MGGGAGCLSMACSLKESQEMSLSAPIMRSRRNTDGTRGWVNYFAIGDSSECFSFVRDWVEKKIRRI
jgi:hypothetical protein